MGPKSDEKCPCKKEDREDLSPGRQRLAGLGHQPSNTWSFQKLEEARRVPQGFSRRHLDFRPLDSRTIRDCVSAVSSAPVFDGLLR